MSENVYLITRMENRICSFLMQDGRATEIHRDSDETDKIMLGDIYIGKVKNIAKQLDAAFVEIAPGHVCYLAMKDLRTPIYTKKGSSKKLQAGDELLVQISRERIKSKYPSVTTNVTLHGKYVLLTSGNLCISVSSKIDKMERERLSGWMKEIDSEIQPSDGERSFGWLLRTNAKDASQERIRSDALRLSMQYKALISQAGYRTCFSCLMRTPPQYLVRLQNLYSDDAKRIITDDQTLFDEIYAYLSQYQKEDTGKLELYHDRLLPMQKLYSLEKQLALAFSEKVWLKSGGYLVIQPTEALTSLDVNTGKYEGGKNQEASFLKINREAAIEIAHQLRLRNLSGIIIVDFINMKQKESVRELLTLLDGELKKDPVPTKLIDMTKLSLVEITRMKREKPLS